MLEITMPTLSSGATNAQIFTTPNGPWTNICSLTRTFFSFLVSLIYILSSLNFKRIHYRDQNAAFQCTECDKSFLTKIKLGYHMKNVHSTERPYKCRFCPKDFKVKKLLCEHERLHTGERPFQCPHCPKTFRVQVF